MRASGHNGRRAAHGYEPTHEPLYISGSRVGKRADTSALVCYFDDTTPIGRSPEPRPSGAHFWQLDLSLRRSGAI
jgi:hypothetical protein